jgi:predicted secreted Zn-dependent protease
MHDEVRMSRQRTPALCDAAPLRVLIRMPRRHPPAARPPLRAWTLSAVCLALAACGPRGSGVPRPVREPAGANVERAYYDVTGGSMGELLASLKEQGRAATQSDSNFARTTWTVTWTGQWAPAPGDTLCAVVSSSVRLESRMALPRWRPAPGAPSGLATDWAGFVRKLAGHENGHLVTAVAAAREVDAQLEHLRGGCATMEAAARAAIDRVVAHFRLADEDYDRRTAYGALQGAVWPPRTSPRLRIPGPQDAIRAPPSHATRDGGRP